MKMKRVAVGMFFTECNQLAGGRLAWVDFERRGLFRGEEMLAGPMPAVLRGMVEVLRERGVEVVPLVKAEATCGGPLTAECWSGLRQMFVEELKKAGPVDGVLMALHGSAVAEDAVDPEGELLGLVKWAVGKEVPVVASLDHHANVTRMMVENAEALVAWETYPHRDAYETGRRGARILVDAMEGKIKPRMAVAKAPVLVSGCNGHTDGLGPFADLMRKAKGLEGVGGVISANMILVHPYLDVPEMGGGGIVVTDGDAGLARELAEELARDYWERRRELEPEVFTPEEAIAAGMKLKEGPVLLVETADCVGGGAAGDSVATFKALLKLAPGEKSVSPVVDFEAAEECHKAGEGATVRLKVGHWLDEQWGEPAEVTGVVERLIDGEFVYDGGFWGGMRVSMGRSALLKVGEARLLIMSIPTYDWKDEQFRAAGVDWRAMRFVVVKNPMNYRLTLRPEAAGEFLLDTPGPTPATLRHVKYERMKRPYFPGDEVGEVVVYES
jgi:microcystin degradation protein MlrC